MEEAVENLKQKTFDELIRFVCSLLKQNDPDLQKRLEIAYRNKDYPTVQKLLRVSLRKVKKHLSLETQKQIKQAVIASRRIEHSHGSREGDGNMKPLIFLTIALLIAILAVSLIVKLRQKPKKGEKVGAYIQRKKPATPAITYTEQDRDMLELIHLLATITNKTNEFLEI